MIGQLFCVNISAMTGHIDIGLSAGFLFIADIIKIIFSSVVLLFLLISFGISLNCSLIILLASIVEPTVSMIKAAATIVTIVIVVVVLFIWICLPTK